MNPRQPWKEIEVASETSQRIDQTTWRFELEFKFKRRLYVCLPYDQGRSTIKQRSNNNRSTMEQYAPDVVVQRARSSGMCPPTLLAGVTSRIAAEADGFEAHVFQVMDLNRRELLCSRKSIDRMTVLPTAPIF